MAWTNLTFAFGSLLTATKMTQLDANLDAIMAGDAGAPKVQTAAIADNAVTTAKILDGTVTMAKTPNSGISQGDLNTSIGEVATASENGENHTLPGGEYGFFPQIKSATGGAKNASWGRKISPYEAAKSTTTSYATRIILATNDSSHWAYMQQRYVTASGEVHWIFFLRNKHTGKIISAYQAPDHPCFGNGGKPAILQHPFDVIDRSIHELVIVNPSFDLIETIEKATIEDSETIPDRSLLQVILEDYIISMSDERWPDVEVTTGLPKHVDYRFFPKGLGDKIKPIKKIIPRPPGSLCRSLIKK